MLVDYFFVCFLIKLKLWSFCSNYFDLTELFGNGIFKMSFNSSMMKNLKKDNHCSKYDLFFCYISSEKAGNAYCRTISKLWHNFKAWITDFILVSDDRGGIAYIWRGEQDRWHCSYFYHVWCKNFYLVVSTSFFCAECGSNRVRSKKSKGVKSVWRIRLRLEIMNLDWNQPAQLRNFH